MNQSATLPIPPPMKPCPEFIVHSSDVDGVWEGMHYFKPLPFLWVTLFLMSNLHDFH